MVISVDEFSEIILQTLGKKSDLVICDTCLQGNISTLDKLKDVSKYFISSPNYLNYDSFLQTEALYQYPNGKNRFENYCKAIIDEYIELQIETFKDKTFMISVILYKMNLM